VSNATDVKQVVVPLDAASWAGDNVQQRILRAPNAEDGGGLTILRAYAVNEAATGAGTAFSLSLHNYGTAGTAIKADGGTVAAPIGGTADPFAAGVPKAFVLSNAYLAAGEWLVLDKRETNSSDPTRGVVVIDYLLGK